MINKPHLRIALIIFHNNILIFRRLQHSSSTRITFYISFIISFIKTITQKRSEETFSFFFEKLFNDDLTPKSIYFIKINILNKKSPILQKKNDDNLYSH